MPKDTFLNLSAEKRNRILNAAMSVFSKVHYKKVTIDRIVNDAGIPKGSFYQYFEDKDDLYQYLFSQIGDQKKQALDQIKEIDEQLSFKEYVIRLLEAGRKFEAGDLKLMKLKEKFTNECSQEVKKKILENEVPKSHELLEEVITSYIQKGELRKDLNSKLCAYMLTSCVLSLEYYQFEQEENMDTVISKILDTLLNGLK